jgi:hypothetical protein
MRRISNKNTSKKAKLGCFETMADTVDEVLPTDKGVYDDEAPVDLCAAEEHYNNKGYHIKQVVLPSRQDKAS